MPDVVVRYLLAAVALTAACTTFVFASASFLGKQNNGPAAQRAYALVPFNAEYAVRLAGWNPKRRTELLQRAVTLNPFQVSAWMQLGLDAEFREGNPKKAERFYQQAAAVDHMFLPKWTLTNFYFRQGNKPEFLTWAKGALQITPYPPDPIFAELWVMAPQAGQREAAVPDRAGVLDQYLMFLFNDQQWNDLPPVLERLVHLAGNDSSSYGLDDVIGPMLDRLLGASYLETATRMWSILCRAHWLSLQVPDPTHPLTNGQFAVPIWGHGFDWLPVFNEGIRFSQNSPSRQVRFELSGDESEDVTLLQQWLPLQAEQRYTFRWSGSSRSLGTPSGFSWRLRTGRTDQSSGDLLEGASGTWTFETPQTSQASLLGLRYVRPLGEMRAKGVLDLTELSLRKP